MLPRAHFSIPSLVALAALSVGCAPGDVTLTMSGESEIDGRDSLKSALYSPSRYLGELWYFDLQGEPSFEARGLAVSLGSIRLRTDGQS